LLSAESSPLVKEANGLRPFTPGGAIDVRLVFVVVCSLSRVAAIALALPPITAIEPITATARPLRRGLIFMAAPFVEALALRVWGACLAAGSSAPESRLRATRACTNLRRQWLAP
jgi:hypothetical protein